MAVYRVVCYRSDIGFLPGLPWPAGIPDLAKYEYKVISPFEPDNSWLRVCDTDDPRPEAVLLWLANYEVHLCGDKVILYGDNNIYHVSKHSVHTVDDTWQACIEAYGVWEGEDVVIYFQLVKDGVAQ